jgi:hypothetical protein
MSEETFRSVLGVLATLITLMSPYIIYKLTKMHNDFNSKMDKALKNAKELGLAEGKAIGREEEHKRLENDKNEKKNK